MTKVKPTSEMDNQTFLKHMNARHGGLAGLDNFGPSNVKGDSDEHLLRALHDWAHEHGKTDNDHKHRSTE